MTRQTIYYLAKAMTDGELTDIVISELGEVSVNYPDLVWQMGWDTTRCLDILPEGVVISDN